jgi:hypothetical protein
VKQVFTPTIVFLAVLAALQALVFTQVPKTEFRAEINGFYIAAGVLAAVAGVLAWAIINEPKKA